MKVTFNIRYFAQWGEYLCILGEANGYCWTESDPFVMTCIAPDVWSATIELSNGTMTYHYAVRHADGSYRHEWNSRTFDVKDPGWTQNSSLKGKGREGSKNASVNLIEYWQEIDPERVFCRTPFCGGILSRKRRPKSARPAFGDKGITFRLHAPMVEPSCGIALMGNIPELGQWDGERKLPMSDGNYPIWEVTISPEHQLIEYKYAIYDLKSGRILDFEPGDNRLLNPAMSNEGVIICNDYGFRRTSPLWKGAGTAIPVFSLRTHESFGIGEFPDLIKFGKWAAATGQRMIQTLPVNDTTLLHTNKDSYPYNAVSVFALNPNYLNIERMGQLKPSDLKRYQKTQKEFNDKSFADYQVVADEKMKYFRLLYAQTRDEVFASEDFKSFFTQNKEWLEPYAAFCFLRDFQGTPNFTKWKKFSTYSPLVITNLCDPQSPSYEEVALHYFLQYHADKQLKEAHKALNDMGIGLKGDIPIGISPNSVDAWCHPELFRLNTQTGAPPDAFSISGQNWGFPTYNWDAMAKDHFDWFCHRFRKMADGFDAYRIDHVLGFFRIWEMPVTDVWGLCGRFCPALPYTIQELHNSGIDLPLERLTQPYIKSHFLPELFGELTDYVKRTFLTTGDGDSFTFKTEFDTQRKIKDWFDSQTFTDDGPINSDSALKVRDGLYYLHCEVLFVEDLHTPGLYHPRVMMKESHTFADLPDYMQNRLLTLHDDFFYHRNEAYWKESAMKKLPALIGATDMLVCAEDLGMVPACVPEVMKQLNILSLEVQRMPKGKDEFSRPANAPYLSVCTTSSHDTNPLRAWWEEDAGVTQRYYNQILGHWGEAPRHASPEIIREIITDHLASPALWVILPLQDWLAMDSSLSLPDIHAERINVPDNPDNFWCYRMHLNVEELLSATHFNLSLKSQILNSGR